MVPPLKKGGKEEKKIIPFLPKGPAGDLLLGTAVAHLHVLAGRLGLIVAIVAGVTKAKH